MNFFLKNWKCLTSYPLILQTIEGLGNLEFCQDPPKHLQVPNLLFSNEKEALTDKEIPSLLDKNAICQIHKDQEYHKSPISCRKERGVRDQL